MVDPFEKTMYVLLALLNLTLVMHIIRLELRRHSIAVFLWLVIFFLFSLPSLLDPFITSHYTSDFLPLLRITDEMDAFIKSQLFTTAFCILYLISRKLLRERQSSGIPPEVLLVGSEMRAAGRPFLYLLAGAAIVAMAAAVGAMWMHTGIQGILTATYSSYRLESNPFLKLLGYYLITAVAGGMFIASRTKHHFAVGTFIVAIFVTFVLGRSRQVLLPAIIPFALCYLYGLRFPAGWIRILAGGAALYAFFFFWQLLRYQGGLVDGITTALSVSFFQDFFARLAVGGGEASLRWGYYFWFTEAGTIPEAIPGQTYIRLLLLPIPSALAEGIKPPDLMHYAYQVYYNYPIGDVYGTYHSLLFTDAYLNFGWPGVLMGLFWGGGVGVLNRQLEFTPPFLRIALAAPIGTAFVMIGRGTVYNSIAIAIASFLILLGCHFLSKLFAKPSKSPSNAPGTDG